MARVSEVKGINNAFTLMINYTSPGVIGQPDESAARPSHRHSLPLLILATTHILLKCGGEIASQLRRGKTRGSFRYRLQSPVTSNRLLLDRDVIGSPATNWH